MMRNLFKKPMYLAARCAFALGTVLVPVSMDLGVSGAYAQQGGGTGDVGPDGGGPVDL